MKTHEKQSGKSNGRRQEGEKLIASNPSARANYFITEVVEAGLVLCGTEVKSLRLASPNLKEAFVEVRPQGRSLEAWLLNATVSPYSHGNIWNHDPSRRRKLLLHAHQLKHLWISVTQKGQSVIPLRMYFKKGLAKVELGIGKGKKKYDKRETLKKKSAEREMDIERKASRLKSQAD
ncbi:MAG: SsrA-binding protein SmpB [Bdellovibrionia bacterium]